MDNHTEMDNDIEKDNSIESVPAFSYEVFDRQLHNFFLMMNALVDGWNDMNDEEFTLDIHSLYIKASKLCYMADQDLALQHADVTQQRKRENHQLLNQMEVLVKGKFSIWVLNVMEELKNGELVMGHESPMFDDELSNIFPRLFDLFQMEGMDMPKMLEFQGMIPSLEAAVHEGDSAESPNPQAPDVISVDQAPDIITIDQAPDILPKEIGMRLWNFLRLYALSSYLLLHFRRVCHVTSRPLEAETITRLTEAAVQKYMNEEEGKRNLDLYQNRLRYENDGKPLDVDQWMKARRELKQLVPASLELAFLYYVDDSNEAGNEIAKASFTHEEFNALLDALAKHQLITRRIYEISHPEEQSHLLPNEAFNTVVKGKSVNLQELKKSITKMARLVEKKNQWFCVWSVLKHLNIIKEGCTFAAFAHQMMSPEWFGKTEGIVDFTADNLTDYSRYFNEYDYTEWNEEMFLEKKELYGMTKWSLKLFQNFSQLCQEMLKAIWGYSFLV